MEQGNIEAFELLALKDETRCEKCYKDMSVEYTYCRFGASEEVHKQSRRDVIQNFELLATSAFNIQKELSRANKYGTSKEAKEHGKTKDALTCAEIKCHLTIERYGKDDEFRERMTEEGSNTDDVRKRDEQAKIDRVHCTVATENSGGKTHVSKRELLTVLESLGK